MSLEDTRRRSFLLAGATALTGGLAGCTGMLDELSGGSQSIDLPVEGEATRVEYGESVTGTLTADDPSDPEYEGHYVPYTFMGSEGDRVQIRLRSENGDPYLFLLDEEGNLLAENDDTSMNLNSGLTHELPADGGYVILAGSFSDEVGFEFELSLSEIVSDLRSISVGETKTGLLDSSDPQDDQYNGYYEPVTLDAETGATVNVSMSSETGDTYLYLLDPNDQVVARNDDFGSGLNSFLPRVTLTESGEYTIIATSFSDGATFTYDLSVTDASVEQTDTISVGETITGDLSSGDTRNPGFNGYYDAISLDAETGATVDISMTSQGDTYLYLLSPNGQIVAENDDGGSGYNSRIRRFTLSEDGEYTIIATSFSNDATFTYELSVSEAGELPDLRSISVGQTRTGAIDQGDPREDRFNGYYEPVTLDAQTGQTVTIEMTSQGDPYLYLLDPSGQVVAENDDADGLNSRIAQVTLSEDGEYTIIATSFSNDATFEYQLRVAEADAVSGTDLRSISVGQTRTGAIDQGDPQEDRFNGYYEPVTLDAPTGTTVTIDMASQGDTYLYLLGPSGQVVAEDDDGGTGYNSSIEQFPLSTDGEYTIIATSFSYDATFEYQLRVTEADAVSGTDLRSISIGQTRTGEIDRSDPREDRFNGYYEPVTFSGDAGQNVEIEMTSDGDPYLYLLDPSGQVVAENDDASGLNSLIEHQLSETGQYTIIATSFTDDATFEYQLSVREGTGPIDLRSISVGQVRRGELDSSDPRSSRFNGYYEPVTLRVDSTTTVDIDMVSDGDTYLYLLDPNDQIIAEDDDGGSGFDSRIGGVTLDPGEYTIIATSFSSNATFEYQLAVQ